MIRSRVRALFRTVVERLLPWYDAAEEARHNERSDWIHRWSIQVRMETERRLADPGSIRRAYRPIGARVRR